MSTTKHYDCENCGSSGKIVVKGGDYKYEDIVFCPVCGHDIYDEELEDDDE